MDGKELAKELVEEKAPRTWMSYSGFAAAVIELMDRWQEAVNRRDWFVAAQAAHKLIDEFDGGMNSHEWACRRDWALEMLDRDGQKLPRRAVRARLIKEVMAQMRHNEDPQSAAMVAYCDPDAQLIIRLDDDRARWAYGIVGFCERALRY